nr:type VI secretion protein [Raoultella sp. NCTC 9187]
MVAADLSNGQLTAALSVCEKDNVNNNNFNAILSEYSLKENLTVKNSLADDGSGKQHRSDILHFPVEGMVVHPLRGRRMP